MKFESICFVLVGIIFTSIAQPISKPEQTEVWSPEPKKVSPGKFVAEAPNDAIILFDGKNLDEWVSTNDRTLPAQWKLSKKIFTVDKSKGNIETKRLFTNYQLHLEWKIPENITGSGQGRGNSGIFLASTGKGDEGYELQLLDAFENKTYVNGMAGSIYKQFIPLVNPSKKPGEWQSYDVVWTAPVFNSAGLLQSSARVSVWFNGVLVQNNVSLKGQTVYIGEAKYKAHGPSSIKLQAHGDPSEPLSFRNIWLREL